MIIQTTNYISLHIFKTIISSPTSIAWFFKQD